MILSTAVCAACGFLAAFSFRDLETSLPVWFALAPVFYIVANSTSRWKAVLFAYAFALTWALRSFTFMWNCAFEGSIAISIYVATIAVAALLCMRPLARLGGSAAIFGSSPSSSMMHPPVTVTQRDRTPVTLTRPTFCENDV